jgi:hypothetical protein
MYQITDISYEFARSINRGARTEVLCTKITDIWSECARSINRGAMDEIRCTKITDILLECGRSKIAVHGRGYCVPKLPASVQCVIGL